MVIQVEILIRPYGTNVIANTPDYELKSQYAALLLKFPDDPFKAAKILFEPDWGKSLMVAREWPSDPFVIEQKKAILSEHGETSFLPTKSEIARELHAIARLENDTDYRLKAYELFSKIMGFIEKPGATFNNISQNNVMIVKDHGSDDQWADACLEQQKTLTLNVRPEA